MTHLPAMNCRAIPCRPYRDLVISFPKIRYKQKKIGSCCFVALCLCCETQPMTGQSIAADILYLALALALALNLALNQKKPFQEK
ncbi:MAG: hypothetical protein V2B19_11220 [Pseudomonadota bacterium]